VREEGGEEREEGEESLELRRIKKDISLQTFEQYSVLKLSISQESLHCKVCILIVSLKTKYKDNNRELVYTLVLVVHVLLMAVQK
jgi:hypothetical protein